MKWGTMFARLGDVLGKASAAASTKIKHAMVIGSLAELRDNQEEILANQARIIQMLRQTRP